MTFLTWRPCNSACDERGYDYDALIRATPDGANDYDPRYGMDDLFNDGAQGQLTIKVIF